MMLEPTRIDLTQKQAVQYCVPLWLRDEQIQQNIRRVAARIEPGERREDPIAVVCFGPSLNETWEQVKGFPHVISCSGAHKFLVERGIVPTWHVEVDPRPHKIDLIGPPQQGTTYLLASACSPQLVDALQGYDVRLWHVFDATDEGIRRIPAGDWAITGGCDVGLRALTIAAFLGFRNLHVFGMDQSAGTVGQPTPSRHAAFHPHSGKKFAITEYDGVQYYTTMAMAEAARSVKHELEMMPAVAATFYGDGLVQHMMRGFTAAPGAEDATMARGIAIAKPVLISAEYASLNAQLHRTNLAYGVGGGKHADTVLKLCERLKTTSVLDYGCGKGYLAQALPFPIWEYDPAIPGKQDSPRAADLVVCTDVLEHVEPDRLAFVLADLKRCTRKVGYFVIHTGPASKTLPDGRNTHLIQRGRAWWEKRLRAFFEIGRVYPTGAELLFVVGPKVQSKRQAA
jgi:hypothetical protein